MDITNRRLIERDWQILKQIRLEALQTDPGVFCSTLERESAFKDDDWRGWLTSAERIVFGLFDKEKLIGITGIFWNEADRNAVFWGSWISPGYRGKGLSQQLYDCRIRWLEQETSCQEIVVSHRASNEASRKANQRAGFIPVEQRGMRTWPDGVTEDEVFYKLDIHVTTRTDSGTKSTTSSGLC